MTNFKEFSKSQFINFKNHNVKNFVDFAKKVINKFGTDGKILIQPATSTNDPILGYQHLISSRRLASFLYLPLEKTVFEVDLSKPKEAQYILEHIAYIMSTFDTAFILREWTDFDTNYNTIPNRRERMIAYFNDHKKMILGVNFDGFLKIEDIHSGEHISQVSRNEKILIDSYSTDSEGNTFYDVLNTFDNWNDEIWIYKMSFGSSPNEAWHAYYWSNIRNAITGEGRIGRPEIMRDILSLLRGGVRITNPLV